MQYYTRDAYRKLSPVQKTLLKVEYPSLFALTEDEDLYFEMKDALDILSDHLVSAIENSCFEETMKKIRGACDKLLELMTIFPLTYSKLEIGILYEGIRPFDVLIGPILFQEVNRQKAARDIEHPDAFLKVENPSIDPEYPEDVWNVNKGKFQRSVKYLIYKEIK